MMQLLTDRKLVLSVVAVFFILVALLFWERVFEKVVIASGESVPYFLFLKTEGEPQLRDYLLVKAPENDRFAKGQFIVKKVACLPGMYLKISGLDYYCCNGSPEIQHSHTVCIHLGKAKLHSRKGEKVTPFNPCGEPVCTVEVPEDHFFLVNPHPDSYDSRYLGFINGDRIISKLRPVF